MTMVDKINNVIETNPELQTMFDEYLKASLMLSVRIMSEVFEYDDVTESEVRDFSMAWDEIVPKRMEELADDVFDNI